MEEKLVDKYLLCLIEEITLKTYEESFNQLFINYCENPSTTQESAIDRAFETIQSMSKLYIEADLGKQITDLKDFLKHKKNIFINETPLSDKQIFSFHNSLVLEILMEFNASINFDAIISEILERKFRVKFNELLSKGIIDCSGEFIQENKTILRQLVLRTT